MTKTKHTTPARPTVQRWGQGVPAVLVHGSIETGEECWESQRSLAGPDFQLIVPNRRPYGQADQPCGEDFLRDADQVAELLGDGAHLVGHSYGAIGALLAAAARPEAVHSLTVIEPPAFAVAPEHPAAARLGADLEELFSRVDLDDRAFLESFLGAVGTPVDEIPEEMLELWTTRAGAVRDSRKPWEAQIPLDWLAAAPFPKLVTSGAHHPAFDAICDELTRQLKAERVIITGAGHEVPAMAEEFNEALLGLWRGAGQR